MLDLGFISGDVEVANSRENTWKPRAALSVLPKNPSNDRGIGRNII